MALTTNTGDEFLVPIYFSVDTIGTIILPDHVCSMSDGRFTRFEVVSNVTTGKGTLNFLNIDQERHTLVLYRDNDQWYFEDVFY